MLLALLAAYHISEVCGTIFGGQSFPVPNNVHQSQVVFNALLDFSTVLQDSLRDGLPNDLGTFNQTSTSIALFSASQADLIWQYHWTDPIIKNSTSGAKAVDADSVYRVGSISKLITVYLLLLANGEKLLNDPITEYIPELKGSRWPMVTVGDLADHLSGIDRDIALNDFGFPWQSELIGTFGLPALANISPARCDYFTASSEYNACTSQDFIQAASEQNGLFATGLLPAYSNTAFGILGLVIERITGLSFEVALRKIMLDPLGMSSTSSRVPAMGPHSVVPINTTVSGWENELYVESPAAGMFSSVRDLTRLGKSILNGTLLDRAVMRRWMKPRAFTDKPNQSVGLSWEIFRWSLGDSLIEVYTKDGNWGGYAGTLILLPEYNIGIAALAAASRRPRSQNAIRAITKWTEDLILPALDKAAMEVAKTLYSGRYRSTDTNSTIEIIVDDGKGIKIGQFICNGVDVLAAMIKSAGIPGLSDINFRLATNGMDTDENTIGFTGTNAWVTGDGAYPAWVSVGAPSYGGVSLDRFVFHLDPKTKTAMSVEALAWKVKLSRDIYH